MFFFLDLLSRCWSEIPGRKEIGDRVNQLEQDRDMEQKKRKALEAGISPWLLQNSFYNFVWKLNEYKKVIVVHEMR